VKRLKKTFKRKISVAIAAADVVAAFATAVAAAATALASASAVVAIPAMYLQMIRLDI